MDEGYETLEYCSKECEIRPICTGFDLTPTPDLKNKFRCILHGHKEYVVADATSLQISRCYRMVARKTVGVEEVKETIETPAEEVGSGDINMTYLDFVG